MEPPPPALSMAEMLSKLLVEVVDNNAHLMTVLDVQARLLAQLEGRDAEAVADEVSALLKARRREALAALDAWTDATSRQAGGGR